MHDIVTSMLEESKEIELLAITINVVIKNEDGSKTTNTFIIGQDKIYNDDLIKNKTPEEIMLTLKNSEIEQLIGTRTINAQKNLQGLCISSFIYGEKISEIYYKNGLKHGKETHYFTDDQKYFVGQNKNDKRYGTWYIYHENGALKEIVEYKDDKKHGSFTYYHNNGQVYMVASCRNDKFQGKYVITDANGLLKEEGLCKDGYKEGICFERDNASLPYIYYESGEEILMAATRELLEEKIDVYIFYGYDNNEYAIDEEYYRITQYKNEQQLDYLAIAI